LIRGCHACGASLVMIWDRLAILKPFDRRAIYSRQRRGEIIFILNIGYNLILVGV
jgi:hypothetical protein